MLYGPFCAFEAGGSQIAENPAASQAGIFPLMVFHQVPPPGTSQ